MSECLLVSAQDLKFPSTKTGISNSIIIFGNLKGKPVVFKIAADSKPDENALEVERDVYMFVKNVLSLKTPHFTKGLAVESCKLEDIFQSPNSFLNTEFKKKWQQFRGAAIYNKANVSDATRYVKEYNKF